MLTSLLQIGWGLGVSLIIIVCGWNYWRDAKRDED